MEIGRFYATTFDGRKFEFIVKNNKIYCNDFKDVEANKLIIKPRLELIANYETYRLSTKSKDGLIKDYCIDKIILKYMKLNNIIRYSTDMAYLYDLPDKIGHDIMYHTRAYKHIKDKEKILAKQKRGYYN